MHPIGWVDEERLGCDMRELNVDFLMVFNKPESLDVLIEGLVKLRSSLI